MKKTLTFIVMILISCKATNHIKNDCNENLKFKEVFFYHIKNIENNIAVSQDSLFRKSVIFISNYAHVSSDKIMNYSTSYPIGVFEEDRANWIKWYEENKCKNIQFKTEYVTPEVYLENND